MASRRWTAGGRATRVGQNRGIHARAQPVMTWAADGDPDTSRIRTRTFTDSFHQNNGDERGDPDRRQVEQVRSV